MSPAKPAWFTFDQLVLVADAFDPTSSNLPPERRRDLEKTSDETLSTLLGALSNLGVPVTHFGTPRDLAERAAGLENVLVLSIYGGEGSRNRMALVPAICETYGFAFIGPDTYGRVICQDKEVSRRLAQDCGMATPAGRLVRTAADTTFLDEFTFPAVCKAVMEGSSIGIGPRNLVRSATEARALTNELLAEFSQPVLVERFIGGKEVSLNVIDAEEQYWAFTEIAVEGASDYFDNHLFHAEEKQNRRLKRTVRLVDNVLAGDDHRAAQALLQTIKPFGYCRVDGKFFDGRFYFIELTPDAWIDPRGAFAAGFIEQGWSYEDVIRKVLTSRR